jgi:glyoxylase-like metal-dependent hydrolase (beta-lactamase superfamily II)
MEQLRPGLWTWTTHHPDWTPDDGGPEGWGPEVRSYALDAGDSLVLFDPLVEPARVERLADGRPVVVILTCYWHGRSARELAETLDAVIHAPATDAPDVGMTVTSYGLGDELPGDVEAQPAAYPEEVTLWVPSHRAFVIGDAFVGGERGFRVQPDSWVGEGVTPQALREQLRPLLERPVELLLPTHGNPVTEDAPGTLRRALEN